MNRADYERLLERVRLDGDESSAHALLPAFFSGFPVERLRELLQSTNDGSVRAGAWLASELGPRSAPLIADLALLLRHESRYVRFFVLDAILVGASDRDGAVLARAIALIRDLDEAVRWKAINFVARTTISQLRAALHFLQDDLAVEVRWLTANEEKADADEIMQKLCGIDRVGRFVGLVAAIRHMKRDRSLLLAAAASTDWEVSEIAHEWLRIA